jgi:hypothetical protein
MRDDLGLFFALVSLAIGTGLLHEGVSNATPDHVVSLMSGAMFLALGMTCTWLILRNWRRRKKAQTTSTDGYR